MYKNKKNAVIFILILLFSITSFAQHPDRKVNLLTGAVNTTPDLAYDAIHYKIEGKIDTDKKEMNATCTVTIKPFSSGFEKIHLDAAEMEISRVYYPKGKDLNFTHKNDSLTVQLDRRYDMGEEIRVAVDYKISDSEDRYGLNFTDESEDNPVLFFTMFEPLGARKFFPCFDEPNDKATTETVITVKEDYKVLSNGKLLSDKKNKDGTRTFHWLQDTPHATYLVSVVGGDYHVIKDKYKDLPVNYWVYESNKDIAMNSFKDTPKMIEIYEKKFGHPYPWDKYDQVICRGFGGGMEHTSATTLGDYTIHDERAHLDYDSDDLVSHELAHMWFGDLITCKNWGELWLNESFATYSEIIYLENSENIDEARYKLLDDYNAYLSEANFRYIRPLSTTVYDNPSQMFDRHAYQKGSCTLHMLRGVLGDEHFFTALGYYLHKNAHKPVETADFRIAIEEATGKNLDWFFDSWIYQPGHPVFEVKYDWDEEFQMVTVNVKQIQIRPDTVGVFKIPVDIEVTSRNEKIVKRFFIDEKEESFQIKSLSKPDMVRFDKNNWILKELVFEKPVKELVFQAKNDDDFYGRLIAVRELAAKTDDTDAQNAVIDRLLNDKFWGIRREAARSLIRFRNDDVKNALLEAYEKNDKSTVKAEIINTLSMFRDEKLVDFFLDKFRKEKSYLIAGRAVNAALMAQKEMDKKLLNEALNTDSHNDVIRQFALNNVRRLPDNEVMEIADKFLAPEYGDLRFSVINVLGFKARSNEQIRERLISLLDNEDFLMQYVTATIIGRFKIKEALPKLEKLYNETDNQTLKPVVKTAIDALK